MKIRLRRPLNETLRGHLETYRFEVGILNDGPHKRAKYGTKRQFAGGPARRVSSKIDGSLRGVSKDVREFLGFNYLSRPFQRKNDDAVKMLRAFFDLAFKERKAARERRLRNLIQAVVRNPILRGSYGKNTQAWARIKGFNRKLIDTSQFFRSIQARVVKTRRLR